MVLPKSAEIAEREGQRERKRERAEREREREQVCFDDWADYSAGWRTPLTRPPLGNESPSHGSITKCRRWPLGRP